MWRHIQRCRANNRIPFFPHVFPLIRLTLFLRSSTSDLCDSSQQVHIPRTQTTRNIQIPKWTQQHKPSPWLTAPPTPTWVTRPISRATSHRWSTTVRSCRKRSQARSKSAFEYLAVESKLTISRQPTSYVSPSDELMSPCTKKLSDIKGKRFKKYVLYNPFRLFYYPLNPS